MGNFTDSLKHGWNAFRERVTDHSHGDWGSGSGSYGTPDRVRMSLANDKSIIASIYTRIAIDAANVSIRHVRLDEKKRYVKDMQTGLNECMTVKANIDQNATAYFQDLVMTMLDRGVAAAVPIETDLSPMQTGGYDIRDMRVGEVVGFEPRHVRLSVYNDAPRKGVRQDLVFPKEAVAMVYNPMAAVMNEPNSTLKRLIRKISLLDGVDEAASSGKLDLIIQLPYVIKSPARRAQAESRRKDIEMQLKGSTYGIAYTDGTEKITQLNRPAENNLMKQIEYLFKMVYGQLGLTEEIMNGTADEKAMLAYYDRTIEPILTAIAEAYISTFLTKTARAQGQSIQFYKNLFKFTPLVDLADAADKLMRNEVVTANEMRTFLGLPPSDDPKADQLRNSNMPEAQSPPPNSGPVQPAPTRPQDDAAQAVE